MSRGSSLRVDQWGICGRDPNFPTEGRYIIVSCSDEDIRIGAERFAPSSPVVVWGKLDAWSFRPNPEKPGRYYIYVENLYSGEDPNKHVFVHEMPIWQDWAIHRHGDGCYSIEPDGTKFPSAGWTLTSKERGSPVVVKGFEIPLPSQLWKFIPIPED